MVDAGAGYVVFDLETQRSFQDVGGRDHIDRLGISVGVAWDSRTGETVVYREDEIEDLVALLISAPRVVGFNIFGFDYIVLRPYTTHDLRRLASVDMMDQVRRGIGFRASLDNLARATLGSQKTAEGLQALTWYAEGEWDKLIEYCTQDVLLTRDLYEFGRQNGFVRLYDRKARRMREVSVSW